jgi:hypothetical protein
MQLCIENGSNNTVHPQLENNSEKNRTSILGTTQGGTKPPAKSPTSPLGPKGNSTASEPNHTDLTRPPQKRLIYRTQPRNPGRFLPPLAPAFRLAAPLKQSFSPPITPPLLPPITLTKFWRRQVSPPRTRKPARAGGRADYPAPDLELARRIPASGLRKQEKPSRRGGKKEETGRLPRGGCSWRRGGLCGEEIETGKRRGERGEPRGGRGRRRCGRCAAEDALSGGEVGVKLLDAAAAEAGRWATRVFLGRLASVKGKGFFSSRKKGCRMSLF